MISPVNARNPYPNYLEAQLERISTIFMATQTNTENIATMTREISGMDDKVANLNRVTNLLQACNDTQEMEIHKMRSEFMSILSTYTESVRSKKGGDSDVFAKRLVL